MKKYYTLIRSLHLYLGLLISPFLLVFGVSIWVFNHPDFFNKWRAIESEPIYAQINFQAKETDLLTAKNILEQLKINGEVDWISKSDSTFSFPVNKPGTIKRISVNTITGKVSIVTKDEGTLNGLAFLHSMPGPHNVKLRGNSFYMSMWRVTVDGIVYVTLFVSSSGIFLWYFIRPERRLGIYSLSFGAVVFLVLMYFLL